MSTTYPQPRTALQRASAVALLVVLVLAQTLGWLHRGLHGSDGPAAVHATAVLHAHAGADAQPQTHAGTVADAPGWVGELFRNHANASDCRLFDAVAQPACASADIAVQAAMLPAGFIAASHAGFVARATAFFQARAPPLSR